MHFDDFPYQKEIADSYIRSDDFLAYLRDYANHFGVNGLVKLNHLVLRVRPIEKTKWEVSPFREALALVYYRFNSTGDCERFARGQVRDEHFRRDFHLQRTQFSSQLAEPGILGIKYLQRHSNSQS